MDDVSQTLRNKRNSMGMGMGMGMKQLYIIFANYARLTAT